MNRGRIVRATLATIGLVAVCVTAGVLGYRYHRYRARHAATHWRLNHTGWGAVHRDMEIAFEKCWRPRFKDISFFRSDSIMCGGYYKRLPWGIDVSLKTYVQDVDFDGMRIAASSGGAVDFLFGRDTIVFGTKRQFMLEIDVVVRQDAIPTQLDSIAPLQVAFIKDGEIVGDYADLYLLGDFRSEYKQRYTPERVEQIAKTVLAGRIPRHPVSSDSFGDSYEWRSD